MKARQKRFVFLLGGMAALGIAIALVLSAMEGNLSYFFSPTEVVEGKAPADRNFRIGGLVEAGSVKRSGTDLMVTFIVTDEKHRVPVEYTGILPDLFKEGQGMIAQGRMAPGGVFKADEVLAKHDEEYMPPEVAEALAKGHQEGSAKIRAAQQQPIESKPL
jgi:cytochrome c-type biogenesis protein CcmE